MGGLGTAGMPTGDRRNSFGGTVASALPGTWQHVQRQGLLEVFSFRSLEAHVIGTGNDGTGGMCHAAGAPNWVEFGGTGTYRLYGGLRTGNATFTARAEDHGGPAAQGLQDGCGTPDLYRIEARDAATGAVVFTASGYLDSGDFQIGTCSQVASGAPSTRSGGLGLHPSGSGSTAVDGSSVTAPLELYRPTPNPFANTTTIAYAVNQAEGADVSIGIYDVAGRRVRSLVSGYQSAGRYEVVWDGRGDDGAGVARGVYFLRAYVGGQSLAADSRILYLR
jgi:hypothetical protein